MISIINVNNNNINEIIKNLKGRSNTINIRKSVEEIIENIKLHGNKALREYTLKFDNVELKDFLISIFTSPIKCCIEYSEKLSLKFSSLYFIVIAFIISLISTLSLKGMISTFSKSLINFLYTLDSSELSNAELFYISADLNALLDSILPFSKIFLTFILSFFAFFGLLTLICFFIHNCILKYKVKFRKYIVVACVGITIESAVLIIFIILSIIMPILAILFLSVINLALTIILYEGISNLKEKKQSDPYCFAISYTIASFITSFIIIQIIISHYYFSYIFINYF